MKKPQTVLITGASGALGQAMVRRFASENCQVIATYHDKPGVSESKSVQWIACDVTNETSIRTALAELGKKGISPDALIHCAGGFRYSAVEKLATADLDFLIDTNLRSAFLLTHELIPLMKSSGFGRIVFVSARSTLSTSPAGMAAYVASKAGLNKLTESLAEEVRDFDINVNAILPSIIDTPANRRDMPKADPSKWVKPEELAEIAFSLTQPWGKAIHGALIPVSGRV